MRLIQHPSVTRRGALLFGGVTAVGFPLLLLLLWLAAKVNSLALTGAIFCLLLLLKTAGPLARSWVSGYRAEKQVLDLLRHLSPEYVVVANFVPPGTQQGDSDLLVIGPHGILVGEIKNYPGVILYEKGKWYRRQPNGWKTVLKKQPSRQVKANAEAITRLVTEARQADPLLRDVFVPVTPAVIFVGVDRLDVGGLRMAALRAAELPGFIEGQPPKLSAAQVQGLARLFEVIPNVR